VKLNSSSTKVYNLPGLASHGWLRCSIKQISYNLTQIKPVKKVHDLNRKVDKSLSLLK
jgi:hypothetical protein